MFNFCSRKRLRIIFNAEIFQNYGIFCYMFVYSYSSQQVTVDISVLDFNDNPPIITVNGSAAVESVTVEVGEGQSAGQLVYVVVVC